ncbi:MAG: hydroxymethylbilane synthase [Planctomycetota bacterium]|jgi:hydroxymethylbilane synthase
MHIRIASRASKLALAQANIIKEALEKLSDDIQISIVTISTKGDRDKSDFLYKSESVGFFTSEVEKAVLGGRADLAVHSLKDLPTADTPGLVVAAIPKREAVADALVASGPAASIKDLPAGAIVGTSSLRRIAQLNRLRNDLKCVPLRGNVETRVRKVAAGEVDAAIVACAGLNRLGLADKISAVLAPEQFITAPGQGALAVQVRAQDTELIGLLCQLDDKPTRIATEAERSVLATMKGGCSIPMGVYARIAEEQLEIDAMIADIKGEKYVRRSKTTCPAAAKTCAVELANELLEAGGMKILKELRSG